MRIIVALENIVQPVFKGMWTDFAVLCCGRCVHKITVRLIIFPYASICCKPAGSCYRGIGLGYLHPSLVLCLDQLPAGLQQMITVEHFNYLHPSHTSTLMCHISVTTK